MSRRVRRVGREPVRRVFRGMMFGGEPGWTILTRLVSDGFYGGARPAMRNLHDNNQAERRRRKRRRTLACLRDVLRLSVAVCFIVSLQALGAWAQTRRRTPAAKAQTGDATRAGGEAAASLARAVELLQAGRRDEAEPLVRRALSAEPRNADAHTLLGVILDQRGRPREAEAEYRTAIRLRPESISARANLGVLLAREGRSDEAVETFEAVLAGVPEHPQATLNLGLL